MFHQTKRNAGDIPGLIDSLSSCSEKKSLCNEVYANLAKRSPFTLSFSLKLLQVNRVASPEEVFRRYLAAAWFIIGYPDFTEGVRARLIDGDNRPRWRPENIRDVRLPAGFID